MELGDCKRPIVYLTKQASFSSAHRLHSYKLDDETNHSVYGKCNNPNGHGHNYRVEITLRGPVDPVTGMLINLTVLKQILYQVLESLDHKFIDKDVPFFADTGRVSTVENITIYLFEKIKERLFDPTLIYSVKVHETDDNCAEYKGETMEIYT